MTRTLIAIPCFDMVHTDFMESIVNLQKLPETSFTTVRNTMVYDSRNIIAASAIDAGFDRVMWFDSDMTFKPDTLVRLSEAMDEGCAMVSGLYFTRRFPNIKPVVYKKMWYTDNNGEIDTGAENYFDYPEGIIECEAVGFGCVLTSVDLIKRVADKYGSPFTPFSCMGEDMAFCHRVRGIGEKIYCDTRIKCGHVGTIQITEETYKSLHPIALKKNL